jgi:hypothetical protein
MVRCRSATVYEALTKGGDAICRCGSDDRRDDRSLEVRAWMFESAACDHLRLTVTPYEDCPALIELKAALQTALRAGVLQAPHHALTAAGGLMPRASRRFRVSQPTLFHPPPARPQFQRPAAGHRGTDNLASPPGFFAGRPFMRSSAVKREAPAD